MSLLVATLVLATGQVNYQPKGPKLEVFLESGRSFVIETDKDASPLTVANIVRLVKSGYYDALRIHRVESWVIQWGDPQTRTLPAWDKRVGHGPPVPMPFEPPPVPFDRGVVGLSSKLKGTGGDGQIFIVKKDAPHLGANYTILGKVIVGMEVVDGIRKGDRISRMIVLAGRGF